MHHGRAVVVDVADEAAAGVALHLRALALDAPVVDGLEERPDPVLLGELELGLVDPREGQGALVAGLEVGAGGEQVGRAQFEVGAAVGAAVNWG